MQNKTQYRVGRSAEEERLHQMSCAYLANPATRRMLGLPSNETIRKAVIAVDRRDGVSIMNTEERAARKLKKKMDKQKVWVKQLPQENPMTPLVRLVAEFYGLKWEHLFAGGRLDAVVWARYVAMVLAMEVRKWSYYDIIQYFGKKDRQLTARAAREVRLRAHVDFGWGQQLELLREKVKGLNLHAL